MDHSVLLVSTTVAWFCNAAALLCLSAVVYHLDWKRIKNRETLSNWLLAIGFVFMIWVMRAELVSGVNLHLSLAVLFALVAGWRMAILGMACVCILAMFLGRVHPLNLGLQFLLNGLLPVSIGYGLFLLSEAFLPRNVFIYLFGPGFFGAWITMAMLTLTTALVLTGSGAFSWQQLLDGFIPFQLILGFGEAFMTGFILTLLVVYHPDMVYTFRDERYIIGK